MTNLDITVKNSHDVQADTVVDSPEFILSAHRFDPALFDRLRSAWKLAASKKQLSKESLAAWAIIRGADPKRGFSPIVNPVKLANGALPWAAYDEALRACSRLSETALAPWASVLEKDGCKLDRWKWSGDHPVLSLLSTFKTA